MFQQPAIDMPRSPEDADAKQDKVKRSQISAVGELRRRLGAAAYDLKECQVMPERMSAPSEKKHAWYEDNNSHLLSHFDIVVIFGVLYPERHPSKCIYIILIATILLLIGKCAQGRKPPATKACSTATRARGASSLRAYLAKARKAANTVNELQSEKMTPPEAKGQLSAAVATAKYLTKVGNRLSDDKRVKLEDFVQANRNRCAKIMRVQETKEAEVLGRKRASMDV